jgi:spore maturation protein CgeB
VIQRGVYDAFRGAGVKLEIFDYLYELYQKRHTVHKIRRMLVDKALRFKPDLMHIQLQHLNTIDAGTISEIKSKLPNTIITNWTGDVRSYVPPSFKSIARVADYNLISSTGQLKFFQDAIGKKAYYWQIGFDPNLYYCSENETPSQFKYDIIFVGNNDLKENYPGRKEREEACRLLKSTFGNRFALYGSNWPRQLKSKGSIAQSKVGDEYRRSFCLLSISHFNEISHYFSDRLLMCMASGRPTISLAFPKWESYFTNDCDLCIVDSVNDIIPKLKFLLKNPDLANFIGKSGSDKVLAEHTYQSRINELLKLVGLR